MLSESLYGRTWKAAPPQRSTRPWPPPAWPAAHDLRHAALSLWLDASSAPAQVAARAGNSVRVPQTVYTHCVDGHADIVNHQIAQALGLERRSLCATASGATDRRHHPEPVRHMSVNGPGRVVWRQLHGTISRTYIPSTFDIYAGQGRNSLNRTRSRPLA